MLFEERKKWNGMTGNRGEQLKGARRNTDRGSSLGFGEKDARHVLLDCLETRNWRLKCLNDKWLNMNKIVAHRKMLRCTNKYEIRMLGRYLDTVEVQ
jgi:hypothetical protein